QHLGMCRTEGTTSDEQNAGIQEPLLPGFADLMKQDLSAVSFVHLSACCRLISEFRISSIGASRPVQISNCLAPCATSISRPPIAGMPAFFASRIIGVSVAFVTRS